MSQRIAIKEVVERAKVNDQLTFAWRVIDPKEDPQEDEAWVIWTGRVTATAQEIDGSRRIKVLYQPPKNSWWRQSNTFHLRKISTRGW